MSPAGADKASWRRTVASPRPRVIEEAAQIVQLVASGAIVVACGGGGVPVVQTQSGLVGVEAVIDKDLAACILAQAVEAQALLILTDVDAVYSSFGTPQQKRLAQISARQARTLLAQGNLGTGSMGPKVDAATSFAEATGFPAFIAQLTDGARALSQQAGTTVVPDHRPAFSGQVAESA